jgi:hypothetical protein
VNENTAKVEKILIEQMELLAKLNKEESEKVEPEHIVENSLAMVEIAKCLLLIFKV